MPTFFPAGGDLGMPPPPTPPPPLPEGPSLPSAPSSFDFNLSAVSYCSLRVYTLITGLCDIGAFHSTLRFAPVLPSLSLPPLPPFSLSFSKNSAISSLTECGMVDMRSRACLVKALGTPKAPPPKSRF